MIVGTNPRPRHPGLRIIGALKLLSGASALLVGMGVFRFLAHDPGPHAERILIHFGLDPNNHFIHAAISSITGIDHAKLRALEVGTFFYATLHTIEGTGLILGYHWAEYLVVFATGSLVPFELYELARKLTLIRGGILILNVVIVIYLIAVLRRDHRARVAAEHPGRAGSDVAPMGKP